MAIWGQRREKYDWLSSHSVGDSVFVKIKPEPPFYFFKPQNMDRRDEYEVGFKLTEAMPCFGLGFQSSRDNLVVSFDKHELERRIGNFIAPQRSDVEVREEFFRGKVVSDYAAGDTRQWSLSEARRAMHADPDWPKLIRPCLYRPFDWRVILYDKRMVDWPRPEVLGHMMSPNLCLISNRQSKESFGVMCANVIPERKIAAVYDASSSFPLYLYPDGRNLKLTISNQPNFSQTFLKAFASSLAKEQVAPHGLPMGVAAEDIFHYIYSVFHSPEYRSRYADFLKVDFPHVPLLKDLELFQQLMLRGSELVALHIMESPKLSECITTYINPENREVTRVGWSDETVWLDAGKIQSGQGYRATKPGKIGFHGVPEEVWNFHIGGYQVCHKWLKDRKGRILSDDDITHYQKIIVAISETIRLMGEIDEVIEQHGGWPGAFQTSAD